MKPLNHSPTLNSNNSSKITENSSNIYFPKKLSKNNSNSHYSNTSIFTKNISREISAKKPIIKRKEIYLTDVDDENELIINNNIRDHNMSELFNYKLTKSGKILPHIKRKPPTIIYCCDEKYEASNLSNLYDKYWVNPPIKKKSINFKRERIKVRDSSARFIEKTKNIILSKYNLKIKQDFKTRIERNKLNEIKSLDNTINKVKRYTKDLEDNFVKKYIDNLRNLYLQIKEEREKCDVLNFQLINLLKEVNVLRSDIKKFEVNKKYYEKWILFQILMDKGFIPKENLKLFLEKEYNNKLIFESYEEIENWFEKQSKKNLKLLNESNIIYREKEEIKKQFIEENKLDNYEKILNKEIKEKERLLSLLKLRNEMLIKEKIHVIKLNNKSPQKKSLKKLYYSYEKPNKIKDNLYLKAKYIYNFIIERMSNELNNIDTDLSKYNTNEEKILRVLTIVEIILNFLIIKFEFYNNDTKNLDLLKKIKNKIELDHKIKTANKRKIEEQNRILELQEKIEKRNKKFIYIPKRKIDLYPYGLLSSKKRSITEDNVNKEIGLFDFLYDVQNNK